MIDWALRACVSVAPCFANSGSASRLKATSSRVRTTGPTALLALLALMPLASHASNSAPDWVKAAAQQTIPELPESTKAVVLLDETTYTVDQKGQAVEHVRRVTKILRPQGREYGEPMVYFDKDSKVLSMHVWSIDPGGKEYALKDNEIIDFGVPGGNGELYNDERFRVAEPPGRDPGGIVAIEYERRERPYLAEAIWDFQTEVPHLTQSFTLRTPSRSPRQKSSP